MSPLGIHSSSADRVSKALCKFAYLGKKLRRYRATSTEAPAPRLCPVTTRRHPLQSLCTLDPGTFITCRHTLQYMHLGMRHRSQVQMWQAAMCVSLAVIWAAAAPVRMMDKL